MSDWGWIAAFVGVGSAGVLAWLWRSAEKRMASSIEAHQRLETRNAALESSLAREEKARKRQADELASYRKKAEKARKRETRAPAQPLGTASRLQDLELALASLERERDRALAAREAAEGELARVRGLLEKATMKTEPAVRAVASSTPAPSATIDPIADLEAERVRSRERIATLEAELLEARQAQARMRKRVSNQEQLYASIRSELEVKKDRLRRQEEQLERLQALKVAMLD